MIIIVAVIIIIIIVVVVVVVATAIIINITIINNRPWFHARPGNATFLLLNQIPRQGGLNHPGAVHGTEPKLVVDMVTASIHGPPILLLVRNHGCLGHDVLHVSPREIATAVMDGFTNDWCVILIEKQFGDVNHCDWLSFTTTSMLLMTDNDWSESRVKTSSRIKLLYHHQHHHHRCHRHRHRPIKLFRPKVGESMYD